MGIVIKDLQTRLIQKGQKDNLINRVSTTGYDRKNKELFRRRDNYFDFNFGYFGLELR